MQDLPIFSFVLRIFSFVLFIFSFVLFIFPLFLVKNFSDSQITSQIRTDCNLSNYKCFSKDGILD